MLVCRTMARSNLGVPGFFDNQNLQLSLNDCKVAVLYRYVAREHCYVIPDESIPISLANNLRMSCPSESRGFSTNTSIDVSDSVFALSERFSETSIDVDLV